jgi:alpha-glucosidase (family GH31 glycosyl hydrolase)
VSLYLLVSCWPHELPLRPQYVVFPKDEAGFDMDDQFYVGASGLLVKPVTEKGATETSIYLAEDQVRDMPFIFLYPLTCSFG